MLEVRVHKADAGLVKSEVITSGSVKTYKVFFSFVHPIWSNLTKKAVFRAGSDVKEVLLDDSHICEIPWELLQTAGAKLEIGVFGTNREKSLPTVWVSAGTIKQGVEQGQTPSEPTPDVYEQIIGKIGNLEQLSTEHKNNLVEAINEVKEIADAGGSGGGGEQGTIDHSKLINRDIPDQHPMSAITGLEDALKNATISETSLGANMGLDESGKLICKTTSDMEQDNTLPITSAAVFTQVGNIEALLQTI